MTVYQENKPINTDFLMYLPNVQNLSNFLSLYLSEVSVEQLFGFLKF